MVNPTVTSLLEIVLDAPHVMIPKQTPRGSSNRRNSNDPNTTNHALLSGRLIVRLAKRMRIRSLHLVLTGAAHTSFQVTLPLAPSVLDKSLKKVPSASDSHYQHSFKFLTHTWSFLESTQPKGVHIFEAGMHSFPFSVNLNSSLPCTFTTATTAVHYQLTATLRPASFFSFVQGSKISLPVILLPSHNQAFLDAAHGFESGGYMRLQSTPSSAPSMAPSQQPLDRLTGEARFPCRIFTQTGMIPVTINLTLVGQATALTKMSVELWEAVYKLDDDQNSNNNRNNTVRQPLDVRLTSRQTCPLSETWKPSTLDCPASISKRLLFKVPKLPMPTWSKNKDGYTAMPGRGFCHTSGEYLCSKIKIEHTLKLVIEYQYETPMDENSGNNGGNRSRRSSGDGWDELAEVVEDMIEAEQQVMIVSHMDLEEEDDLEPPCYYRSFTSVPVNPSHIPFIDAAIDQTLRDDHPEDQIDYGHRLPDYEECVELNVAFSNDSTRTNSMRSQSSVSVRSSFSLSSMSSLDQYSMMHEGPASPPRTRPSSQIYQSQDLSSYVERYSRGEIPPIPV